MVPHFGQNVGAESIRDVAQAADDLGFASIWTADHVALPATFRSRYPFTDDGRFPIPGTWSFLDIFPTLGYLAGVTNRVKLGVGVCIVPYRNAVMLAKLIASVDQLSEGRFIFGAGVGWLEEEFDALGVSFADRGKLTDETLRFLDYAYGTSGPLTFEGDLVKVNDMLIEPGLYAGRAPDVWVGGVSKPALRRTAQFGSTWFPHLTGAAPDLMQARVTHINDLRAKYGRDGGTAIALFLPIEVTEAPVNESNQVWERRVLRGTASQIMETVDLYTGLGVAHFKLVFGGKPDKRIDTMKRLVEAGLPVSSVAPELTHP